MPARRPSRRRCTRALAVQGLLAAVLCAATAAAAAAAGAGGSYAAHRPAILLLGDSLTEFGWGFHWQHPITDKGWVALLAEAYSRKADVVNRGMSGYNSRWGLQVLPQALADQGCSSSSSSSGGSAQDDEQPASHQSQPARHQRQGCNVQLLVIWYGTNDAAVPDRRDGRLAVPLSEYSANLAAMIAAARDAGVRHVVLVTPPPVDEAKWARESGQPAPDRTDARAAQYAAAVRGVAQAAGVPLLDVHQLMAQLPPDALGTLLIDGVHFSGPGNALVASGLLRLLDGSVYLAGIRASQLPVHYPTYAQVDAAAPADTFRELWQKQVVTPRQAAADGQTVPLHVVPPRLARDAT